MDMRHLSDAKYQVEDELVSFDEFNKAIETIPGDKGPLYAYHARMIGEFASKEHDTSITMSLMINAIEDGNPSRFAIDFIHDSEEITTQCHDSVFEYVKTQKLEDHIYEIGGQPPELHRYFNENGNVNE